MLWYKGWLETRFKVWLSLGSMALFLAVLYGLRKTAAPPGAKPAEGFALTAATLLAMTCSWFAGAGINTQPEFQATRGLHGSTQFTLSLPVGRLRLLAVRASLGWLEMACSIAVWCCGSWLVIPVVRGSVTAMQMFEYAVAAVVCGSALYFLSVLLATFLDDQWRMGGTMMSCGALGALSALAPLPHSVDIMRAIAGSGSPLIAHSMPWSVMLFSAGLTAILFFASLNIVQRREY